MQRIMGGTFNSSLVAYVVEEGRGKEHKEHKEQDTQRKVVGLERCVW